MKNFIKTLLLSSFFYQLGWPIEKLPLKTEEELVKELNKKKNLSLEDFEHENKGCPENSDCSSKMGKQRTLWLDLMKSYQKNSSKNNFISDVEKFRKSYGIPVDFYTREAAHDRFFPILFESPCSQHNPKKDGEKILVASTFMQDSKNNQAHLTVLDTKYDIPLGDLAYLDPLYIISTHKGKTETKSYRIPKGEKPLYLDGESIVLLREHDGLYYGLKIQPHGEWQVIEVKPNLHYDDKIVDETCPKNDELAKFKASPDYKKYYLDQFCQSIYDIHSKTQKTMALFWTCT